MGGESLLVAGYCLLLSRSCKTPETQATRGFRRFLHPANPREIKMADIKT